MSQKTEADLISPYFTRADQFKENLEAALEKDEFEKASELLWGILAAYANALSILRVGNVITDHRILMEFLVDFGNGTFDSKFMIAVRGAEKVHANFYHGFIKEKEDFAVYYENMLYAAEILHNEILRLMDS